MISNAFEIIIWFKKVDIFMKIKFSLNQNLNWIFKSLFEIDKCHVDHANIKAREGAATSNLKGCFVLQMQ